MREFSKDDMRKSYDTIFNNFNRDNPIYLAPAGSNGLSGFANWECYMLVKYGNNNNFNVSPDRQYLLELPLYPDQVTESITPEWVPQKVLGRSAPLSAYAGTSLKTVTFSLDLHRDLLTGSFSLNENDLKNINNKFKGNNQPATHNDKTQIPGFQKQTDRGPFATRSWYVNANKMLQMACYPQYTERGLIPPTTYFIFGQMILKGYVTSYQTEWKKPILNTFYGWNSVSISMECYPDSIISADEIIEAGEGRGNSSTQNTYNTAFPNNVNMDTNVMARKETLSRSNARTIAENSTGGTPGGQVSIIET